MNDTERRNHTLVAWLIRAIVATALLVATLYATSELDTGVRFLLVVVACLLYVNATQQPSPTGSDEGYGHDA